MNLFSQGTLAAACSPVLSSSVLRDTGNTLRNALLPEPAIYYILAYSVFLSQKEIVFKKWPIIFVFVPLKNTERKKEDAKKYYEL